ncbi:MAG TPA: glycosyltransferase family 4 protein [Tepidisphaeraceae bacterium]|jgi:glycosyltransferase involved in cell wall biosynthesis
MSPAELTAAPSSSKPARTPAARLYRAAGSLVVASLNRHRGITGVHTHTHALEHGLKTLGCGCAVISPFDQSRLLWEGVFALRPLVVGRVSRTAGIVWYRHWHEVALRRALTAHLQNNPADVVLAQCPVTAHAALHVREKLGLNFKITLVCHFNHSEAEEYRKSGDLPSEKAYQRMLEYEAAVLHDVDQVIYVSDWARQIVEQERNIHPRLGNVIHNGIPELTERQSVTRQELGLSPQDLVLINVGTLEPRKNQIGLIDLFEKIAAKHEKAKLVLVGAGHQRSEIEAKIGKKNLGGKVKLLGSRSDVAELLALSDLYLHYAKLENCPVVLLECARAGLAFAAVAAGGIPELQRETGVDLALDPNDLDRSMAVLSPVLTDQAHRLALGRKARAAFLSKFTTEAMAKAYLNALGLSSEPRG